MISSVLENLYLAGNLIKQSLRLIIRALKITMTTVTLKRKQNCWGWLTVSEIQCSLIIVGSIEVCK